MLRVCENNIAEIFTHFSDSSRTLLGCYVFLKINSVAEVLSYMSNSSRFMNNLLYICDYAQSLL